MKKKHRILAAAVTAIVMSASMQVLPFGSYAADSYQMEIKVDVSADRKEISPYIYGVNDYGNTANYDDITVNAVRQGGNRYTAYNWETNWSNAGADWKHSSDTNIGDASSGAGYAARRFSEDAADIPYKMTTLQMAGYVSADKNGTVSESEAAPSDRWKTVKFNKDGELSLTPDTTDDYVYMDEYVNYIVKTLGDATTKTGMQGYSLDNEPVLWNSTHPRMHSEKVTNNELISKSIELAKVVKSIDSKAEVFGPAFWGMLPCIQIDEADSEWLAVKNNYTWYMDYYLDQMKKAEEENGKRLLDVFDVHYYAQGAETDADILQAARSLYDPEYVENSWLQPYFGSYFPFLTRMQESIDKYYPGTKLAITEYNVANIANEKVTGKSVVSAIAEAEALGAFALNDVYLATYWGTLPECPYVESAINLYTNYDGNGSSFGDTLVSAKTDDLSKAAAFASVNGDDDSVLTMTLSNKDTALAENAVITIDGTDTEYKSAVVYAITQDKSDIKIIDIQNNLSGNEISVTLPALSVAQIVLSDENTDVVIPEEPEIIEEKVTYNFSDLEISENGFPMLPLGDKEHLKQLIVNTTAYSNAGSSYGGGGGAFCFNNVVPEGETTAIWGSKPISWSLGTGDTVIEFDENFTIAVGEENKNIKGVTTDEYTEIQSVWWKYSEKDETGADITITYNTVTLVYEYPASGEIEDEVEYDINNDGKFSSADVVLLQKWLVKAPDTKIEKWQMVDMNSDSKLNVFDLCMLKTKLISVL